MPIVDITLIEGRSDEAKARLCAGVTEAVVSAIGAPREAVRVILREVPPQHFAVGGVTKAAVKPPA
ncbi:2-hydroxymuconate tautomerase [Rhodopila globiformis]|uniref:Tautomerase n=1 Tax=Rhodopila globiformis TaxID=1071 RepID=A0A2S6NGK0_RHOGL|nr:2-hydroxymuconate tautomerase [Rhodopila globiformis]PPQ33758.1 2-hydroxymuconate tautomerase [Rhodopila globiformis]